MATTTINVNATIDGLSNVDSTGKATGDVLEWNGTSGKWEAVTPSGGGGTPAGTSGQVQFNDSGSFGADSAFHWDNTSKGLGIGATPTNNVRLDVRAQGALSTDIAFRVRNSADTFNQVDVRGDSVFNFRRSNTATASINGLNLLGTNEDVVITARSTNTSDSFKTGFEARSVNNGILLGMYIDYGNVTGLLSGAALISSSGKQNFGIGNNSFGWSFLKTTASTFTLNNTVFSIYPTNAQAGGGTLALGTTLGTTLNSLPATTYGKNTFFIANGTAPSTTGADAFGLYSADITAGNAAPHFRTEAGDVIKLYKETTGITSETFVANTSGIVDDSATFGGYTMGQVVAALKAQGLLA